MPIPRHHSNWFDTYMTFLLNPYRFGGGSVLVAYPDANPETSTFDAYVGRGSVDETFATIRAGAGNIRNDSASTQNVGFLWASTTSNRFQNLRRGIFLFDTSSISSGATINSVTLSLYGSYKDNSIGSTDLVVVNCTTASNTSVNNSDFANVGSTEYGSIAYGDFDAAGWNVITLSTSAVVKAGITKLATRLRWDLANSFSGTWSSNVSTVFQVYNADNGSNKPTLTVNYTP